MKDLIHTFLCLALDDSNQSQCYSHLVSSAEMILSNEKMTSMTFRDPATGTVYLQTQLLQVQMLIHLLTGSPFIVLSSSFFQFY